MYLQTLYYLYFLSFGWIFYPCWHMIIQRSNYQVQDSTKNRLAHTHQEILSNTPLIGSRCYNIQYCQNLHTHWFIFYWSLICSKFTCKVEVSKVKRINFEFYYYCLICHICLVSEALQDNHSAYRALGFNKTTRIRVTYIQRYVLHIGQRYILPNKACK